VRLQFWIRAKREQAPPAPFPNTEVGRKLYDDCQNHTCVILGHPHYVRYLRPGDVVSLHFHDRHHRESFAYEPVEQECYLLLEGSPLSFLSHLLGNLTINYTWGCTGTTHASAIREVRVNNEPLALPITPATPGALMV